MSMGMMGQSPTTKIEKEKSFSDIVGPVLKGTYLFQRATTTEKEFQNGNRPRISDNGAGIISAFENGTAKEYTDEIFGRSPRSWESDAYFCLTQIFDELKKPSPSQAHIDQVINELKSHVSIVKTTF